MGILRDEPASPSVRTCRRPCRMNLPCRQGRSAKPIDEPAGPGECGGRPRRQRSQESPRMDRKTIVISINASWNIYNFRRELIAALQNRGFRVVALAPEDDYSERLRQLGVEVHPLRIDSQGMSPLHDLLLLARYRSALRRIRPDLLLGYTIKPNVYGSLAARSLGIPVINNVSGLGTAFIRGGALARIATALYRLAFRGSSTVFFQNRDDRALFLGKRIVAPERARLLPGSGIDLDRFRPADAPRAAGGFAFLFVGRLLWDKGVREFVDA